MNETGFAHSAYRENAARKANGNRFGRKFLGRFLPVLRKDAGDRIRLVERPAVRIESEFAYLRQPLMPLPQYFVFYGQSEEAP
jgi:hypothetical protein